MLSKDRRIIIFIALLIVRIPLTRVIGDNGLGFLAGPLEIYWCILLLFGSGITSTMSGMMRERIRRDQIRNADLIYSLAKKYVFISSVLLLIIMTLSFDFFSSKVLVDSGSRLAFLFVGLAIFLGMLIDLNIGFLSGTDNTKAAILGEAVDAFGLIAFMIIGGKLGSNYGTKISALLINSDVAGMYGAMGAMIGLCVAELITLIVLLVMTIIYQRSFKHLLRVDSTRRTEYVSDVSGSLLGGMLQDGAQALILQLPVIVLITFYRKHGIAAGTEDVGAMIGSFYGKYLSIVGILSALAVIPVVSSIKGIIVAANDSDNQLAGERIVRLLGRIMYFTIPATVFTTLLVNPIVSTLFTGRTTTVSSVLTIGSSVIVLYGCMYTLVAILIRLGYGREMLFVSGIGLVISIVLGFILVYKGSLELKGIAIILMIVYGFIALFCLLILFRNFRFNLRIVQQVLLPLVISGIIGILLKLLSGVLLEPVGGILTLVICIIPGWLIYNLACMFLRVVSASAMERKLFGKLLVQLGANIGIY